MYQTKYDEILSRLELVTEVSRIIYQIYIALKLTSKIMSEVTYSWSQYLKIISQICQKVVSKLKKREAQR